MSYLFGVRKGARAPKRVSAKLDGIAADHGCSFVELDEPGREPSSWWSGPNRGEPWDSRLRDDVARACADAGLEEWCPSPRAGRPLTRSEPIDQQIAIKVTASQRAGLDAIATERGVTLAVVVRDAIDRYLESE